MSKRSKTILIITAGVLVVAALILSYAGKMSVLYLKVDQVRARATELRGRFLRVHGTIKMGSWRRTQPRKLEWTFVLTHRKRSLPVYFVGVLPDTFKEGGVVVVEGTLVAADRFRATSVLTVCASKYDERKRYRRSKGGK